MDNNGSQKESTVFSAPANHNDYSKKGNKRVLVLTALAIFVVIIAGIIFLVNKKVPDKTNKTDVNKSVKIATYNLDNVEYIESTANGESFKLLKKENTEDTSVDARKYRFYLEDIELYKQDESLAYNYASVLVSLKGIKQEESNDELYGFDNPDYSITVNGIDKKYTLLIGKIAPEGRYVKLSGDFKGVYVIDSDTALALCLDKIGFAKRASYPIAQFSTDVSAYEDSGGALLRFDKMKVSGSDYETPLEFTSNNNEANKNFVPFLMNSPYKTYASNAELFFNLFTNNLGVDGGYSYYDDEESVKKFGLDNPDIMVELTVGSETKWFKMKRMDNTYLAVLNDDFHMIRKVAVSNADFIGTTVQQYIFKGIVPYKPNAITSLDVTAEETQKSFSFTSNENGTVTVKSGETEILEFDEFYNALQSLNPVYSDVSVERTNATAVFGFNFADGSSETLIFVPTDGSKYNFSYGLSTGQISATNYRKLIKKLNSIK